MPRNIFRDNEHTSCQGAYFVPNEYEGDLHGILHNKPVSTACISRIQIKKIKVILRCSRDCGAGWSPDRFSSRGRITNALPWKEVSLFMSGVSIVACGFGSDVECMEAVPDVPHCPNELRIW